MLFISEYSLFTKSNFLFYFKKHILQCVEKFLSKFINYELNNFFFMFNMPNNEIHDINWQRIKSQAIINENNLRMKWFIKNKQRLLDNLTNGKNSKIVESQIKSLKDDDKLMKREEKIPKVENIDKCPSISNEENIVINCMRPVDPSTLKIIYKTDKECHNEATKSYLRKRYELRPKDKFHVIECSNWIYGWHTNYLPAISSSTFGKKFIIYDSFYRRNSSSINRDPDLSRIPQTTNPKNFNELLNS